LNISKRFLRHVWHTKARRHDRRVTELRLLWLSKTVLYLLVVQLFLVCDRNGMQVMLHMVTEYMERRKASPIVNDLYSIMREVASYQLVQHSSLHSRADADPDGYSE
jgi:hypothetical protein